MRWFRGAQRGARAEGEGRSGHRGLHAFATLPEAAEHLRASLREGDLVLLKGSGHADRLHRIVSAAIRERHGDAAPRAADG
jgi:UDP-N-acetylmuramyl pentapeptide synthase